MSHNPKYISYSRLDSFNRCERCHAWDALVPRPSGPALEKGSHAHAGWEAVGLEIKGGLEADKAVAAVLDNDEIVTGGPLSREAFSSYMVRALPVLRGLEIRDVEQWIPRDSPYDRLVGKIDLVSENTPVLDRAGHIIDCIDEPCVIDYKTTSSYAYIKDEDAARKSIQPMIYALAMGIENFAYFSFLPAGPPVVTAIRFTEEELAYGDAWLRSAILTVEDRWKQAWVEGQSPGNANKSLHYEGYDLSVFAAGPLDRPFIDTKFSRHRELCLGLKG